MSADDETVWVKTQGSGSAPKDTYHTDRNCSHGPGAPTDWDRTRAENWGLEECPYCAGTIEVETDQDHSVYQALRRLGERENGGGHHA